MRCQPTSRIVKETLSIQVSHTGKPSNILLLRGKKNTYKHTHTRTQTLIQSEKREEEKWSEGTHFPAK
jgi:hypothetical protein